MVIVQIPSDTVTVPNRPELVLGHEEVPCPICESLCVRLFFGTTAMAGGIFYYCTSCWAKYYNLHEWNGQEDVYVPVLLVPRAASYTPIPALSGPGPSVKRLKRGLCALCPSPSVRKVEGISLCEGHATAVEARGGL